MTAETSKTSSRRHRRHHRHHRARPTAVLMRLVRQVVAVMAERPITAVVCACLAVVLATVVTTTTLPIAVAERNPKMALRLGGDNAVALVTLASRRHDEMMALLPPVGLDSNGKPVKDTRDIALEARTERAEEIKRLKVEIGDLAARAIAVDPLSATAYRLAGESKSDPDEIRRLMTEAYARSRHESPAVFWLLNAAYERSDYPDVVDKADALLRTRPELRRFTLSYLYSLMASPEGRDVLVKALAADPPWRTFFFKGADIGSAGSDDMLAVLQALKALGKPASNEEITPYLDARLFQMQDVDGVYNAYLQLLPEKDLAELRPVNNLNFATDPNGTPFDWRFPKRTNVTLTLNREAPGDEDRALVVHFPIGRIVFPGIEQVVFLHPGNYRLEGQQYGHFSAKRGMRWTVQCFGNPERLAASDQLMGQMRSWQVFAFDFTIPEDGSCNVQSLKLVHDSRSPSEEYATGDIGFRRLTLTRLPDTE